MGRNGLSDGVVAIDVAVALYDLLDLVAFSNCMISLVTKIETTIITVGCGVLSLVVASS